MKHRRRNARGRGPPQPESDTRMDVLRTLCTALNMQGAFELRCDAFLAHTMGVPIKIIHALRTRGTKIPREYLPRLVRTLGGKSVAGIATLFSGDDDGSGD